MEVFYVQDGNVFYANDINCGTIKLFCKELETPRKENYKRPIKNSPPKTNINTTFKNDFDNNFLNRHLL